MHYFHSVFTTILLLSRFSRGRLCVTPWTAAYQAPPSMGFSRQEYWSGLPLPSPKLQYNSFNSLHYTVYPLFYTQ